jgi:hypothetical protein
MAIRTYRQLVENNLILEAHCIGCMRFESIDLEQLLAEGRGDTCFIMLKPKCTLCGKKGEFQIRPKGTMIGDGSPKTGSC